MPRADLEKPRQHGGGEQVFQPVIAHQRDHQHRRRSGCGRDHARPPAGDRDQITAMEKLA
jgi:ABC-type nickel/cobalt efflux system permease component RcnA